MSSTFLLGIDVEDPRHHLQNRDQFASRAPDLVRQMLAHLAGARATATFFVVGEVAREHPGLVADIVAAGHEIGCHSDLHVALDKQSPEQFRADLTRSLEALNAAGAKNVRGYRAPYFSLTGETRWVYPLLAQMGLTYSSSTLPAASPLYGWAGAERAPSQMDGGVWELPITLYPHRMPPLPLFGGVYVRNLPAPLLRRGLRAALQAPDPLVGYLHPYDHDVQRAQFPHPGFHRFGLYNWLLRRNRHRVFERLALASGMGFTIRAYGDFVDELESGGQG